VRQQNLNNRERKIRHAVLNGAWIQDGLRHGFATYYNATTKDPYKVCYVTGDIIKTVKRHYMRAVKKKTCDAFWDLTPAVVLADEPQPLDAGAPDASSRSPNPVLLTVLTSQPLPIKIPRPLEKVGSPTPLQSLKKVTCG
jgi:hypothetical protein